MLDCAVMRTLEPSLPADRRIAVVVKIAENLLAALCGISHMLLHLNGSRPEYTIHANIGRRRGEII